MGIALLTAKRSLHCYV